MKRDISKILSEILKNETRFSAKSISDKYGVDPSLAFELCSLIEREHSFIKKYFIVKCPECGSNERGIKAEDYSHDLVTECESCRIEFDVSPARLGTYYVNPKVKKPKKKAIATTLKSLSRYFLWSLEKESQILY